MLKVMRSFDVELKQSKLDRRELVDRGRRDIDIPGYGHSQLKKETRAYLELLSGVQQMIPSHL
jgi:hypothetical protein